MTVLIEVYKCDFLVGGDNPANPSNPSFSLKTTGGFSAVYVLVKNLEVYKHVSMRVYYFFACICRCMYGACMCVCMYVCMYVLHPVVNECAHTGANVGRPGHKRD